MSDHDRTLGVGELIARRHREGSTPGARSDSHRLALVIEGGSSRGAYSHGMAMAIEELGVLPCFDAVYGASAGALNAAWLLCGRAVDARRAWNPEVINRVINPTRALRGGRVVDTEYLVHTVYERLVPMDFPAILANPVTFHPIATDADTGAAVDLHPGLSDPRSVQLALKASTCLPILAGRPVRIGAHRYVDAGLSESVPVRTALTQGATRVLVLRTRRDDETMRPPSTLESRVVARFLAKHAPGTVAPWLDRVRRHHSAEREFDSDPAILQIRPPHSAPDIGRIARDPAVLREALTLGRAVTARTLSAYLAPKLTA
ncbi:patatin-like phospholipase family protein [Nocardia sp. CDC160]|uniref:patatin-like phospholipase family protein n=1 Tax=Nocardia sp. CDC160 TaxID=3112166 RepID=UPI002DBAC9C6|nr:patatin family protein [Nocardia sp. CDC160]MEC3916159.1 patatin family protein [Nocardia sp. CDC160]